MAKRVLFTASTYSHIANFHLPYLRAFQERGYQVYIACGGTPRDLPYVSGAIHLPLTKSMASPRNFAAAAILHRELRAHDYALISCHTALAAFFTRLAVLGLVHRPPVACTVHGYLFDDQTPGWKRALLAGAEKLTAPVTTLLMTMNAWDDAYSRKHRLGKHIAAIPGMGVDLSSVRNVAPEEGAALRRQLGFGAEDFLLVYAAEFSRRKNHAVLLRGLAELPNRVKLLLPGDGALRTASMALAEELGLKDRVVFPGQVRNMPAWYAAADAAASSSRSEGLPFNIMEAMGRGLPVAASAVKGHTDLIEDGVTGLLYPPGDPGACASQLRRLLEDPALRKTLGERARASMAVYDISRVLPQVMAFYDLLLSDQRSKKESDLIV